MDFVDERLTMEKTPTTLAMAASAVASGNGEKLLQINPKIANAIRSIQAERDNLDPIKWPQFSEHSMANL